MSNGENPVDHGLLFFYVCFAKFMGIECPFQDLKSQSEAQATQFVSKIDQRTTPVDLRRFLQQETKLGEPVLRLLAKHFLHQHASDKLFLVVAEYLYTASPEWFHSQATVSMAEVAEVLEPVLGQAGELPAWTPELEKLIEELSAYEHLHDLARFDLFDRGRKLKARVSAAGMNTMGLVTFARFNYLLRKTFSRLWDAEVWWIEQALIELESRAEFFIDCSEIGLSPIVPTNELFEMVCEWKRPSFNDYANDVTYQKVQKIRQILETALLPEPA
ncbi:MAG TPA: hypothetical protein VN577_21340 [Terriglobales bacterium]|nr:hypothetical protein [Terriglobales bacterium]